MNNRTNEANSRQHADQKINGFALERPHLCNENHAPGRDNAMTKNSVERQRAGQNG